MLILFHRQGDLSLSCEPVLLLLLLLLLQVVWSTLQHQWEEEATTRAQASKLKRPLFLQRSQYTASN